LAENTALRGRLEKVREVVDELRSVYGPDLQWVTKLDAILTETPSKKQVPDYQAWLDGETPSEQGEGELLAMRDEPETPREVCRWYWHEWEMLWRSECDNQSHTANQFSSGVPGECPSCKKRTLITNAETPSTETEDEQSDYDRGREDAAAAVEPQLVELANLRKALVYPSGCPIYGFGMDHDHQIWRSVKKAPRPSTETEDEPRDVEAYILSARLETGHEQWPVILERDELDAHDARIRQEAREPLLRALSQIRNSATKSSMGGRLRFIDETVRLALAKEDDND